MNLTSARLPRTLILTATAGVAALVLAACGSTATSSGNQPLAGMGSSPSASAMGSEMGGEMGSSPSASGTGSEMGGEMGSSPSASGMDEGMGMGSDSPTAAGMGTPAAGPHNSADVAFLTQMVPHHTQAVAMADLAATRAKSPQVRTLAAAIKAAQGPEITEMSGWLRGWSAPVPSGEMSDGMAMSGMMSAADMANLAKLTGTAFDRTWLTMMTSHHQGALTMAQTELKTGANPDAKILARSIIAGQTAQITQMKALLTQLPAS